MSPSVDVNEFLAGFLAESEEHLRSAAQNLLALDASLGRGQSNPRAVRDAFRAIHTIKGLSGMVGADPIVDIAHAMESLLRAGDRTPGLLGKAAVDPLMQGLRAIEQRVRALERGMVLPLAPPALLDALLALDPGHSAAPPAVAEIALEPELLVKLGPAERQQLQEGAADGKRALRVDFVPTAERAAQGLNITSVREKTAHIADIVKVVPRSIAPATGGPATLTFSLILLTGAADADVAAAAGCGIDQLIPIAVGVLAPKPGSQAGEDSLEADDVPADPRRAVVRVDVERLDDALERLSALVVTRFRLVRAVAELRGRGADVRSLAEIVTENGRQLRDLRAAIMRARMVPMRELLERVPLIVRGLSRTTGKPVRVVLDAGDVELDKAVADRLFPAIVHLVRNAVDHGLEPVEERRRAGKPDEGCITVRCGQRSSAQLELTVQDDGGGIDAARVARKAGQETPATPAALLDLITRPGFSTTETATTTSGRGLGMDIVRRVAVDQLGGELALETTLGVGTTFVLHVPLTLTIVDAFSFACGAQPFVVPVSMIEEILEVEPEKLVRAPGREGGREVRLLARRGETVPLLGLAEVLDLPGAAGAPRKALIVRRHGEPFGFGVDRILGQQEVVVRPLDDRLVRVPGITGSTDLGDGKPILMVDLLALAGLGGRSLRRAAEAMA